MSTLQARTADLFEYILTHYRGIFATVFLLPLSSAFKTWVALRNRLAFYRNSAPAQHDARVQAVIAQIEQWRRDGCREKLCTARSGWNSMSETVPRYKLTHRNIQIGLYDILALDTEKQTVRVEPLVDMGQLSRYLIPRGWMLAVTPELDTLTVGGLIMGFGVETSSHKYGLFQHICTAFEIVTAEGKLLRCTPEQNTELYYAIPWSHGTLGFLVAAEIKIVPAKKYVKIHYQPIAGLDAVVAAFESACRDTAGNDFVEALTYSRDSAVLMRGKLTDKIERDGVVNPIGRWYKPWFYLSVKTWLDALRDGYEYIPLRHYCHRHTRSYFWMMEEIIPFGNHPLFRVLLGWALPPSIELLKYTETETTRRLSEKHQILQDMLMPISHMKESLTYFDDRCDIYPLWLSPMTIPDNSIHGGFIHPHTLPDGELDTLYVDIGAYGIPRKPGFDNRIELPKLEKFVMEHQGFQALYAKTLMSLKDFRTMFDHSHYDKLRAELPYCTQAFDEVYDKVSTRGRVAPVEYRHLKKKNVV
jgi:Delta24-sterol reductase